MSIAIASLPEIDSDSIPTRLSWGAVIAGCVVALSLHVVLVLAGLALGVALVNPQPYRDDLPGLSIAAGVAWTVSALISLWIGGWVAGRTGKIGPGNAGGIHGMLVWAVSTVVIFLSLSSGTSLLVGGALKTIGSGAVQAASRAGMVAHGSAADRDLMTSAGLLGNFVDEAMPDANARGGPAAQARARREITTALARTFTEKETGAREDLVQALVRAGKPAAEADELVRSWEDAYTRSSQALEAAATRATKKTAVIAAWTFIGFVTGALFAAWGGRAGAHRSLYLETTDAVETAVAVATP